MELTIQVTKDDIASGARAAAMYCPIALALRRTTGLQVRVGTHCIMYGDSNESCPMPPEGTAFVKGFDGSRHNVQPIELTLEVPDKYYGQQPRQ